MSRLTNRTPSGHVTLQENIVPIGCSRPTFCRRKNCPYARDGKRDCPMLRMVNKLADLEDKIDNGELVEAKGAKFLIVTSGNKDINIRVSGTYPGSSKAFEALTLMFDAHLRAVGVVVKQASLNEREQNFFVEYTNGEIWSAQIISA